MTAALIVVAVVMIGTLAGLLVWRRRRAAGEDPKPVSIERRLGPTRAPITPDGGSGPSLQLRTSRPVRRDQSVPELPADPWGLDPDKSVAPFLSRQERSDPSEEPPQAAERP